MSQITVFSGQERRRRWSAEARRRLLAEAFAPGACVSEVARHHDVATGLLYTWRRKFRQELPQPAFAEAVLAEAASVPSAADPPVIIVELGGGGRVSIAASSSAALAAAVLQALR